jgi:hypothetical protein
VRGLEYPASYNYYENGVMTLRHYPGRTVADKFVSKTAGIAPTPEVSQSQTTDLDVLFRKRCVENPWFPSAYEMRQKQQRQIITLQPVAALPLRREAAPTMERCANRR